MFAASPKPLAIAIALTLCACATQTTVTGVIVDTHGEPVSQAVVTMVVAFTFARVEYSSAADPDWVASDRCRPANQRAARLGRAGIFADEKVA